MIEIKKSLAPRIILPEANKPDEQRQLPASLESISDSEVVKNKERTFSYNQGLDVLAYASRMQELDEVSEAREIVRQRLGDLPWEKAEQLSANSIIEMGEKASIRGEYVQRAIDLKFPRLEEVLAELREVNATFSARLIVNTYSKVLMRKIQSAFPADRFDFRETYPSDDDFGIVRLSDRTEQIKKGLFKKRLVSVKKTDRDLIVYGRFSYFDGGRMEFNIYSPDFLRACKGELKLLKDFFKYPHHFEVRDTSLPLEEVFVKE